MRPKLKILISSIIGAILLSAGVTSAISILPFQQGGTGLGYPVQPTPGSILFENTNTSLATSSDLVFATSTKTLSVTYASSTEISATALCLNGDATPCRTTWPTGSGGGSGTVGTSSVPVISQLAYFTTNTQTPALLSSVATSSPTFSSPFTTSGTPGYLVGGSGFTVGCQAASGSQAGCLASADWTTFNNKVSSQWTTSGSNINRSTGVVNIGTTTPTVAALTIDSGGGSVAQILNLAYFGTPIATIGGNILSASTGNLNIRAYQAINFGAGNPATPQVEIQTSGLLTLLDGATTTNLTDTGSLWLPLGTPAGSFLAVDPNGKVIATSTPAVGGSGTVTSVATNNGITGGTITTTGTLSLDQTFAAIWTAASSTYTGHLALNSASTTQFSSPTIWNSTVGNALWLGDSTGKATAYTGTSCTNQFVRSLNGTGVATCATVANTDLANSSIVVNGTTFNLGDNKTITAASSSALGDNNTFSGNDTFSNLITGSVSGNAGTATALQNPRTINGVSFNGTANIVIATTTLLGDNNTFSGIDNFTNASSNWSGTWQTFSPSHFQVAGTYVTGVSAVYPLASTGGTAPIISSATSSASSGGVLAAADWTTFNNKVSSSSLSADTPLAYSPSTGVFSIQQANGSQAGFLASADWTNFNGKLGTTSISGTSPIVYNSSTGAFSCPTCATGGGITAIGNYATTTATTLSFSTTTTTFNGLTFGQTIGVSSGALLFTPTITGTYTGQAGNVANAVTFNSGGSGASSGATFNGSSAQTISYNTIGAQVAGTYVTAVNGTTNQIASSGGTTPTLSLPSLVVFPSAASTTLFSAYGPAYFGASATSSFASTGILTLVNAANSLKIPFLGTAAGAFLAVDPSGNVISTTTPAGSSLVSGTSLAVQLATAAALPANAYSGGVLTEVGTGALTVDGTAASVGNRILVKNEVAQTNNGIYSVTAAGSGIAAYVLTRVSDYNSSSNVVPGEATYVVGGSTLSDDWWALTTVSPITVGGGGSGSNLTYVETNGSTMGTVTSVGASSPNSTLTLGGTNPVTSSGTINFDLNLTNPNAWTGRQNFNNSTSTLGTITTGWATNWNDTYASSTAVTVSGQEVFSNLTSALVITNGSGVLANYAGASNPCTNQLPTTISALGVLGGCSSVSNAMLSNSTIGATSPNSTLTFGTAASLGSTFTADLNLGTSNQWTASTTFTKVVNAAYASSTAITVPTIYSSATSTIQSVNGINLTNGSHGVYVIPGASTTTLNFF